MTHSEGLDRGLARHKAMSGANGAEPLDDGLAFEPTTREGPGMRFGVFDHMDRSAEDLSRQYEDRLTLVEAYDRAGLYAYHLAEHHGTPLGLAPSPSVFLSAVAQRTTRLRLGPLVYTLALYDPVRLVEEVCMLDALSGGRLELGVGRGISPIELRMLGVDPEQAPSLFAERLEILLCGLTSERLSFEGEHHILRDVPMELRPVQRPHPPLWYGVGSVDSAARVAHKGMNAVANGPADSVRSLTDAYRAAWSAAGRRAEDLPLLGRSHHLVIADTDAEALDLARPAYRDWYASLDHLWRVHGTRVTLPLPEDPDVALAAGLCVAGSPATVRDRLLDECERSGVNYLLGRFAFGGLPLGASLRSVDLFQREIAPAFEPSRAV
jgi:alkanesulfonate monooxygenase SsuD/methylene tetrahydromethanopterin reductase-like flavin-dependent oxidoreductase (luciferase family)